MSDYTLLLAILGASLLLARYAAIDDFVHALMSPEALWTTRIETGALIVKSLLLPHLLVGSAAVALGGAIRGRLGRHAGLHWPGVSLCFVGWIAVVFMLVMESGFIWKRLSPGEWFDVYRFFFASYYQNNVVEVSAAVVAGAWVAIRWSGIRPRRRWWLERLGRGVAFLWVLTGLVGLIGRLASWS